MATSPSVSPSAATLFYQFLQAAVEEGIDPLPKGSAAVVVDLDLCGYLAEEVLNDEDTPMNLRVVMNALRGLPVKTAFGISEDIRVSVPDIMERDRYLRNYARKRVERKEKEAS